MASGKHVERRKSKREPSSTEAEMYLESTVYKARMVDFSDDGVCSILNRRRVESPWRNR